MSASHESIAAHRSSRFLMTLRMFVNRTDVPETEDEFGEQPPPLNVNLENGCELG